MGKTGPFEAELGREPGGAARLPAAGGSSDPWSQRQVEKWSSAQRRVGDDPRSQVLELHSETPAQVGGLRRHPSRLERMSIKTHGGRGRDRRGVARTSRNSIGRVVVKRPSTLALAGGHGVRIPAEPLPRRNGNASPERSSENSGRKISGGSTGFVAGQVRIAARSQFESLQDQLGLDAETIQATPERWLQLTQVVL